MSLSDPSSARDLVNASFPAIKESRVYSGVSSSHHQPHREAPKFDNDSIIPIQFVGHLVGRNDAFFVLIF